MDYRLVEMASPQALTTNYRQWSFPLPTIHHKAAYGEAMNCRALYVTFRLMHMVIVSSLRFSLVNSHMWQPRGFTPNGGDNITRVMIRFLLIACGIYRAV